MERYELVKLVEWAATLKTRKAMQKVIYLLQAAGCPFDARFSLHHFGPYSSEVARRTDELVQLGLLAEEKEENLAGSQFNYTLTEKAKKSLKAYEATAPGKKAASRIQAFRSRARELFGRNVKEMETAATIAYFRKQKLDWAKAVENTCRFKSLAENSEIVRRAKDLAQEFVS